MKTLLCIAALIGLSGSALATPVSATTKLLRKTLAHSVSFDKGLSKPEPLVNNAWNPSAPGTPMSLQLLRAAQSTAGRQEQRSTNIKNALEMSKAADQGKTSFISFSADMVLQDARRIAATGTGPR